MGNFNELPGFGSLVWGILASYAAHEKLLSRLYLGSYDFPYWAQLVKGTLNRRKNHMSEIMTTLGLLASYRVWGKCLDIVYSSAK